MTCANHSEIELTSPCARCEVSYCDDCLMLLGHEFLCADCKNDALLDVVSGTNIERKPLARIPLRIAAYILDRGVFYALLIGIVSIEGPLRKTGMVSGPFIGVLRTTLNYLAAAGFIVYEALMVSARGQTLGKMAAKVRVVRFDGTPVRRWQAWGRAITRSLCSSAWLGAIVLGHADQVLLLMFLGIANPLVAVFTPGRTALHDLVARTRVYRVE